MGRRLARTKPTATELARVERVLVTQPAFASHLGPKLYVEKRTGERVSFHVGTIAVAEAMIAAKLNPERERVGVVLRVAIEVFGIRGREAVVAV
jgi:hypothetical protein